MNKAFALLPLLALFAAAPPVKAQEQAPKLEVYGGYYYALFNINANVPGIAPSATYNGNGGGGQLEYNANRWLGVVGDLSGFRATSSGSGAFAGAAFTYLLGPRVNFRRSKVTPFAQALFGGIWTTDGIAKSLGPENNFAMTAGGGVDIKVSRHVSVRPIQAEYFMTKIPDGLNNRQDNLRLGAGVVYRLGRE
ncbi:MAG TPA: outer membrane beta-barrel protein [Terriglobales bacterium]|nr:outer membrane beta-barrel protein [Terriglobales bacterium]